MAGGVQFAPPVPVHVGGLRDAAELKLLVDAVGLFEPADGFEPLAVVRDVLLAQRARDRPRSRRACPSASWPPAGPGWRREAAAVIRGGGGIELERIERQAAVRVEALPRQPAAPAQSPSVLRGGDFVRRPAELAGDVAADGLIRRDVEARGAS